MPSDRLESQVPKLMGMTAGQRLRPLAFKARVDRFHSMPDLDRAKPRVHAEGRCGPDQVFATARSRTPLAPA